MALPINLEAVVLCTLGWGSRCHSINRLVTFIKHVLCIIQFFCLSWCVKYQRDTQRVYIRIARGLCISLASCCLFNFYYKDLTVFQLMKHNTYQLKTSVLG